MEDLFISMYQGEMVLLEISAKMIWKNNLSMFQPLRNKPKSAASSPCSTAASPFIRDIRSSERLFYQQVLDIFATSTDYDGQSNTAREFFQTVQNKMLYAVTGHTAPELIYLRLDAAKPDLGLSSYQGSHPRKADLKISKNYLQEDELKRLNLIVSGYLDTAEYQAETRTAMTMADWKAELDRYLGYQRADILQGKGRISRQQAEQKISSEYTAWQQTHHEITRADHDFVKALSHNAKQIGKRSKKTL